MVRAIQDARDSGEPLRLLLLGTDLDINMTVGVDDFNYHETAGEVGDIYYSIQLTQWKPYGAKRLNIQTVSSTVQRSGTPATQKTHTVASGDTLWAIAKRAYGNGGKWKTLYEANKSVIGGNPNAIKVGQVLQIP